jgi:hypothetical protein
MKLPIRVFGGVLFAWATLCVAQQPTAPAPQAPDSLQGV